MWREQYVTRRNSTRRLSAVQAQTAWALRCCSSTGMKNKKLRTPTLVPVTWLSFDRSRSFSSTHPHPTNRQIE